MSHYAEIECAYQQKSEGDFVAALEAVFGKGNVEVHEEGADMYGYQGDNRSKKSVESADYAPKCNIIIRRKNVGGASNDVGFKRNEEGGYNAYISDYDKGANFSKTKQDKVLQEYSASVAERRLKAQGYTVKRTVEQGRIKIKGSKW